jgi:S1-C subfamily serine protease
MARICVKTLWCACLILVSTHLAGAPPAANAPRKAAPGTDKPVTDVDVTNLEREAMKSRSAADGLDLYREFLAVRQLSAKQKEKVLDRKKVWQDRVDRRLVRLGTDWVSPEKAKATARAADEFIGQAFEKIEKGDFKRAKDLLDKAVKQDPFGVRADYYIGMLNSTNFWNYAPAAESSFERAHKRDPENPGISNNLALSRLKMGHWGEALDLWAEALRYVPEAPAIVHNLGRFVKEASAKRIPIADVQAKRGKKLYEKALAEKKGPPFNEKTGWLYSPLTLSTEERERSQPPAVSKENDEATSAEKPEAAKTSARSFVGSGTGFVVKPGYILSNRHVAKGGTSHAVFQPGANAPEEAATVVAVDDELDLALFQCEALAAPAVALNAEPPRRSSEVLVLGFPFGEALGSSIKSVRGTVFGFDDENKRKIMLYEANTNPGNSGGPVCDNTGRVIAAHFAGLNLAALQNGAGKFGMGVPIEAAMPFLTKLLPDLAPGNVGEKLDWPEVDQRISPSVVLIRLYVDSLPMVKSPPTAKSVNVFEDRTCTACKGRSKIPCPVKGCFKGSVAEFETSYTVNGVGPGSQVLQWQTPRNRACPGCRGAGVIDCPHCADGLDPGLK